MAPVCPEAGATTNPAVPGSPVGESAGRDRTRLWQRLRRALGIGVDAAASPAGELLPPPPPGPEIEFVGYAEDCRVFGHLVLDGDRLTDVLNEREEYELSDVLAVALADGRGIEVGSMTVRRDELLAVRASGPRGNAGRRSRMRPFPVTLQTGPYTVHGYVHALPGTDPLLHVRRRKPMVPLTEAWIEYAAGSESQRARLGALIVNRELLDWIALSDDEEVRLPDLPAEHKPGPLVKDFTGYIRLGSDFGL